MCIYIYIERERGVRDRRAATIIIGSADISWDRAFGSMPCCVSCCFRQQVPAQRAFIDKTRLQTK